MIFQVRKIDSWLPFMRGTVVCKICEKEWHFCGICYEETMVRFVDNFEWRHYNDEHSPKEGQMQWEVEFGKITPEPYIKVDLRRY